MVRDAGSEKPEFTGARDVNDVRPKLAYFGQHARQVPPIGQVETQVLLDREGEPATWQFERAHRSVPAEAMCRTRTNAKKRQVPPLRKGPKLTTGMSHAIHFVKGIGKIGDPRRLKKRGVISSRSHDARGCAGRN